MRIRTILAVATLFVGVAALNPAQADPIQVNNWPGDVPCSALTKNADGSYTLMQDVTLGSDNSYTIPAGNVFSTTDEYHVWADHCGS